MNHAYLLCAGLAATCSLASAQFGTNLVPNGDFEAGSVFLGEPNDWTTINNPTGLWTDAFNNTPGGQRSLSIPVDSGFDAWLPDPGNRPLFVEVPPASTGGPLTFSYFYNMPTQVEAAVAGAKVDWFSEAGTFVGSTGDLDLPVRITNGWEQFSLEVTPPAGATRAGILLFVFQPDGPMDPPGAGTVYYDDVSLVQTEALGACNSGDLAEPFGVLDADDILAFVDNLGEDEFVFGPNDNRVGNPSVEINFDDPGDDPNPELVPVDWFSFNFDPRSDFYVQSGENGAPAARTGNWMLRAA
ncbi:MAG: hypothetical protein AAF747_08010, partial [Planctomycetota bacterium]